MGIEERKEREKEQRRNAILDAAESLIFQKGIENTTMEEVAEKAEFSKGALYLYFKNKEELYLGITQRGFDILQSLFEKAIDGNYNGMEKIERIGRAYVAFWKKYPHYYGALLFFQANTFEITEENPCAMACEEHGYKGLEVLVNALAEGIKDQTIRPDINPEITALVLWGQLSGIIQIASMKGEHLKSIHHVDYDDALEFSLQLSKEALQNKK
jgi:AcrR family transcriptional regulator